jgi:hypothetical protein
MRRVIVSTYVSLDGVMEDPSWSLFFNEEAAKYAHDQLFASDALLLGWASASVPSAILRAALWRR